MMKIVGVIFESQLFWIFKFDKVV